MVYATVWCPTMWKVFKNPLMIVQQCFNIFGLKGNFGSCSLSCDLAFNNPFNVSMPQNISHTFCRNCLAGISIYAFQYHWFSFSILETYLWYLVVHRFLSNRVQLFYPQHHVGVCHIDNIKVVLQSIVTDVCLQIWDPSVTLHGMVTKNDHSESFKGISR